MVLNFDVFDFDTYMFYGKDGEVSKGWLKTVIDINTGDPIETDVKDSSLVVLPAGQGGYFQPADDTGRTWRPTISK